jgi:AraC family transcriptional regulator, exoenzyme S synthesis regulatory protein ExsA
MEYGEKVLTYKGQVVFGKQAMPYFDRIPKEYIDNEACFVFVNQGEVSVRSQDNYMNLDKNQAVLAKCLNYFFETNDQQKKNGDGVEVIAVIMNPSLVKDLFEFDLSVSNYSLNYNIKQIEVDRLLANFRESINILLDNPELADEGIIKNKLKEFILLMSKSQDAPSQVDFLAALFRPINIQFKTTVQKNMYSNLSVDELARLCHLSTSSFKRKFADTFDESPKKYIVNKKLEKATEMLKSTDARISEIAYDVGFDSLATFNRNFINSYGKSPSQLRLSFFEKSLS